MPIDIWKPTWLAELVDRELAEHDPVAALLRLAPDLRDAGSPLEARARTLATRSLLRHRTAERADLAADDRFLDQAAGHVGLALDVALLAGVPFEPHRRRAELATVLAALVGRIPEATAADPGRPDGGDPAAVSRALAAAGAAQRQADWPPGDPRGGLLLSGGKLALERWLLAALASGYHHQGRLDEAEARLRLAETGRDLALLVETLASQAAAAGRLDLHRRREALRQAARLRLAGSLKARLRQRLRRPRGPAELARATPPALRPFLLERLLLADAVTGPPRAGPAFSDAFASEAGIGAGDLAAMRTEAALRASEQLVLEGPFDGTPGEWLVDGWGEATDQLTDKMAQVVTDNLEAIVREVKQTGELGQLLAKAAAGTPLSADEKHKVRAQLVDLAKAVPALAIFAAPGGMLLLPLLAKLLPFSWLPSAWERKRGGPAAGEPPAD